MKKLLVVDDEPNNLQLFRQILKDKYQVMFAVNGTKALDAATQHKPDLILLDIMMPGIDGYEVCQRLKSDPATANIPVIFVTAMGDVDDETRGFDVGAVDYIQKPLSPAIVLKRIENQLSLVNVRELENSRREAIRMLGEAGHYNDLDTGTHIWRMAGYSSVIATALGWSQQDADDIELAAPMHDTGKIGISDAILKAPRKLTDEEWDIMKTHSVIGHNILSSSTAPIFTMAADIALCHHEKWDGSGYPNGLVGDEIPEAALIVAVADVFDALTTKRPYKTPWSIPDTVKEISKGSGTHFSPKVVDAFLRALPAILEVKASWDGEQDTLLDDDSFHPGPF